MLYMYSPKIKEYCGVAALINFNLAPSNTVHMLNDLQHRGQESAGIVTYESTGVWSIHNGHGLVDKVFGNESIQELKGTSAIGHVRYSTTHKKEEEDAIQPFLFEEGESMACAHNGAIRNVDELKSLLKNPENLKTSSDTEILAHLIKQENANSLKDKVLAVWGKVKGGAAFICMDKNHFVAARDELGIRPLWISNVSETSYAIASETCALQKLGAYNIREVLPNEIIEISHSGEFTSIKLPSKKAPRPCIFEYIYFARLDSISKGKSMYEHRLELGKHTAREYTKKADMVVPSFKLGTCSGFGLFKRIWYSFRICSL